MRARLALVPLVAAAALLAGCATNTPGTGTTPAVTTPASNGVAELPADQIVAKAQEALKKAKSFHVKGETKEAGTATKLDLTYSGSNTAGKVEAEGLALEIVAIGNDVYIKGLDELISTLLGGAGTPAQLAAIKGKYIKVDATNPQFASFMDLAKKDKFADGLKPEGTVTKGEKKTVNGKPAIGVVDSEKSIMYVATEGEPVVLRIEKAGATGSTDAVDFSEFDTAAEIKAPDAANVVDLKSLMGG